MNFLLLLTLSLGNLEISEISAAILIIVSLLFLVSFGIVSLKNDSKGMMKWMLDNKANEKRWIEEKLCWSNYLNFFNSNRVHQLVPIFSSKQNWSKWLRGICFHRFDQPGRKNGILIIALANQYKGNGLQLADAIQQAASRRLRPILMTSITELAGFLPLMSATGAGELEQRSIGTVLFGDYFIASLTSLFIVTTLYVV